MISDDLRLFALNASHKFGVSIASHLGVPLCEHEEVDFEDGEHKARPLVSVRGKDVFVVQSLYADAHQGIGDKLGRLLFFMSTLKDASPMRVIAVIPYLCYARQDSQSQPGDSVTTRYVARLIEAAGANHVLTMEVHNLVAYQNAFRCATDHLHSGPVFLGHLENLRDGAAIAVISPDVGGIKRAEGFRALISARLGRSVAGGFMEKYRTKNGVSGHRLAAEVEGCSVIIFDDMISTGKTMAHAADACRRAGAAHVYAVAAHGLFAGEASALLGTNALDRIFVTNTVPPFRLKPEWVKERLTVLDASKSFASAIERIHKNESIVDLLTDCR